MAALFDIDYSWRPAGTWNRVEYENAAGRTRFQMAALSGATSRYGGADQYDRATRWRGARSMAGWSGPLADRHCVGALAHVWRPLGGTLVPQLPAPSPTGHMCRASRGPHWGVVHWRYRSCYWHEVDRTVAPEAPVCALACRVARGTCLHRRRACSTPRAAVARATELLQRARLGYRLVSQMRDSPNPSKFRAETPPLLH